MGAKMTKAKTAQPATNAPAPATPAAAATAAAPAPATGTVAFPAYRPAIPNGEQPVGFRTVTSLYKKATPSFAVGAVREIVDVLDLGTEEGRAYAAAFLEDHNAELYATMSKETWQQPAVDGVLPRTLPANWRQISPSMFEDDNLSVAAGHLASGGAIGSSVGIKRQVYVNTKTHQRYPDEKPHFEVQNVPVNEGVLLVEDWDEAFDWWNSATHGTRDYDGKQRCFFTLTYRPLADQEGHPKGQVTTRHRIMLAPKVETVLSGGGLQALNEKTEPAQARADAAATPAKGGRGRPKKGTQPAEVEDASAGAPATPASDAPAPDDNAGEVS